MQVVPVTSAAKEQFKINNGMAGLKMKSQNLNHFNSVT
jgi:hypothetical protein